MSRIGRMPIKLPANVKVQVDENNHVVVEAGNRRLERDLPAGMRLVQEDGELRVERPDDSRQNRALHGLTRTLVANMVTGVTEGFTRRLEINGVGYRAMKAGDMIMFQVGFSHPVAFEPPPGVTLAVEGTNRVVVTGADKELVGEAAARIRRIRPPEPYKGKGIKYAEEVIRRKAGKAGGKGKK
ncbi:MAG: 50S ribosomal protein L6 [Chloroflexota bacterium]|nr:50S ribosomal protein L6 [Chloroflexota bacterium]